MNTSKKYKILIVDDSEMNRSILSDMLENRFEIIEAEDGVEAIKHIKYYGNELSLVLLDLVMPNMDGLEVLANMHRYGWIDDIPVIMISAENSPVYIERAYELGVTDFINRPFNVFVVRKRVANTIMLYAKQKSLIDLINKQIYEKEKNSDIMLNILSHIVEFRNGESGLHILHVNTITGILLRRLIQKTDKYIFSNEEIDIIVAASSLHDIGKISIPDHILNKPGRLTNEEFEIMKGHSQAGADMLNQLNAYSNEPLIMFAREICLYHHERYDGKGYPFGLVGDDIPITAQVVSIADVYDALTSERCYKNALPHSKALEMIESGECGSFNPLLLECLDEAGPTLEKNLKIKSPTKKNMSQIKSVVDEMLRQNQFSIANDTLNHLEQERIKNEFFASLSQDIQYEYSSSPPILTISEWCADKFGLPQAILNPLQNEKLLEIIGNNETIDIFRDEISKTNAENPVTQFVIRITVDDEIRHHRVNCRVNWSSDEEPEIISTIGKINDIEDEYQKILSLEKSASTDPLTKAYNRRYSETVIEKMLKSNKHDRYALMLFDVDDFKMANDTYGHLFGDRVLKEISAVLMKSNTNNNIVGRIGGDEFIMFVKYYEENELFDLIKKTFDNLGNIDCDSYKVRLSMGVATTDNGGRTYTSLFNCADSALYYCKRTGRSKYAFYDETMELSNVKLTPIEN